MKEIKMVIDYSGLNYNQVLELTADCYALMRKNAIIDNLKQTEEGRKYLEQCNRINITEPDISALSKVRK